MYAAANRSSAGRPRSRRRRRWSATSRCTWPRRGADPADFEQNPDKYDIPDSVIGFMAGELGDLPGGWPEPFRTKVLAGKTIRIGVTEISEEERAALAGTSLTRRATLNRLLFPGPTKEFEDVGRLYGDLSVVDTVDYLYGLQQGTSTSSRSPRACGSTSGSRRSARPTSKGMRTVMTILNGQLRPVFVRDRSITIETKVAEKADANTPGQVAAPFSGVVTLQVEEGEHILAGQAVASIEAMKMEAAITSPIDGILERVAIPQTQQVDAGDLLVVVRPR